MWGRSVRERGKQRSKGGIERSGQLELERCLRIALGFVLSVGRLKRILDLLICDSS